MTSRRQLDNLILKNRNAVLYVLRITGYPLEYQEILTVVKDSGMMRGFDLNDIILSLLEMKSIVITGDGDSEKYQITSSGKNVCDEMLIGSLSNAEKRKLLDSLLKIFSLKRIGGKIEYSVDSAELPNEKSLLKCRIYDGSRDLLKLELAVDSDFYAQLAAKNFSKRPELIYRNILSILTREL